MEKVTSLLFTLFAFFFCQLSFGQIFNHSYPVQEQPLQYSRNIMNMIIDPDGSTVTVTTIHENNSNTLHNAHVIKVDDVGNILWSHRYGLTGYDESVNAICQTDDGGYLITGGKYEPNSGVELWIFKIDNLGILQWSKRYSDVNLMETQGALITRTFEDQETYLIVGETASNPTTPISIIKINGLGNMIWSNQYYDPTINTILRYPTYLTQDVNNNGYIIVGNHNEAYNGSILNDLFSFGVDIDGNLSRPYIKYDQNNDHDPSITRGIEDDGYVISFAVDGTNAQPGTTSLTGFMKLDEGLLPEWSNLYASTYDLLSMPRSLYLDPHGSYDMGLIIQEQNYGLFNPAFLKIDLSGNPINYWRYNPNQFQVCGSMAQDFTGLHENYVLKTLGSANGIPSIGLIRTQLNGDSECGQPIQNVNVYPINPTVIDLPFERFIYNVIETGAKTKEFNDITNSINCNNLNLIGENDHLSSFNIINTIDIPANKLQPIDKKSLTIYPTLITKDRANIKIEYNDTSESQTIIRIYNVLGKLISETYFDSYNGLNSFDIENISLPQGMNAIGIYKNGVLIAHEKLLRL